MRRMICSIYSAILNTCQIIIYILNYIIMNCFYTVILIHTRIDYLPHNRFCLSFSRFTRYKLISWNTYYCSAIPTCRSCLRCSLCRFLCSGFWRLCSCSRSCLIIVTILLSCGCSRLIFIDILFICSSIPFIPSSYISTIRCPTFFFTLSAFF